MCDNITESLILSHHVAEMPRSCIDNYKLEIILKQMKLGSDTTCIHLLLFACEYSTLIINLLR